MHPKEIIIYLMNKGYMRYLPDKIYLKWKYRLLFHKKLNLTNPQTLNEKLQWLKLYNRKDAYTKLADKWQARDYVARVIGKEYLIPSFATFSHLTQEIWDTLPHEFVLKPNHTSGDIYICTDKSQTDLKALQTRTEKWLKRNYFSSQREWPYKNIPKRLIAEEYLGTEALIDYRFYTFNGKVKLIYQYINEKPSDNSKPEPVFCNIYDEFWHQQNFQQAYPPTQEKFAKPEYIDTMLSLAETLAQDIPFVRVDFYYQKGKIYFSELTFFPGAGFSHFHPEEYDEIVGSYLTLPKKEQKR